MTMDAMRASHFDDRRQPPGHDPSPKTANTSMLMVNISNFMHVIEPVTYNETGVHCGSGMSHFIYHFVSIFSTILVTLSAF